MVDGKLTIYSEDKSSNKRNTVTTCYGISFIICGGLILYIRNNRINMILIF